MSGYFDDAWLNEGDEMTDEVQDSSDPFEGLGKRDQDTFFKVLDLVPDEKREAAMDYFLDHPAKIRAVVAAVKKKKQLIADKDIVGLQQLFNQEKIAFEKADALAFASNNNEEY